MRERNRYIDRVIGHYRIIAGLGNRPASSAYLAQHLTAPGHTVVIKFFHPPFPRNREQYFREVRLLRMLRHPHLLPPLESGVDQDEAYLMSEYALRGSLRQRLARQGMTPLSLSEAGTLLQQVAEALAYAHHFNVMHGNLKPENILFNTKGELWLTDFSWATATDGEPQLRPGSWPYMAPEQFEGMASRASDQYALACLAYELLTGRPPFSGTDFATLARQHTHEQPVAPTQLNLLLPRRVDEVLLQALSKDSNQRFPTVKEFMAALFPAAGTTPAPSLPAPASETRLLSAGRARPSPLEFSPASGELFRPSEASRVPEAEGSSPNLDQPIAPGGTQPGIPEAPAASSASSEASSTQRQAGIFTSNALTEREISIYEQETIPQLALPNQSQGAAFPPGEGEAPASSSPASSPSPAPDASGSALEQAGELHQQASELEEVEASATPALLWNEQPTLVSESVRPASGSPAALRGSQGVSYWREASQGRWILMGAVSLLVILSLLIILLLPLLSAGLWRQTAQQTPTISTSTAIVTVTSTPSPLPSPTPSPSPTATPTPTPSPTPSPTPRPTPTPTPTPTPPLLAVSPAQLNGPNSCSHESFTFRCQVTLSLSSAASDTTQWSASSSNVRAFFAPQQGWLEPGSQQQVTIYIYASCPRQGLLLFRTQDGTSAQVTWTC
ncbi:serine/threonine protein kinase [Thermogemmatispora onikobensis]|uniref:serine/threonine protein kinase n=1 Tax=Thermogemmatispora onikobensis TaxID=732234 RepID=UPI000853242F|nr:serine/threonine-protein kinase [Thermogemmatispora onikobensis]